VSAASSVWAGLYPGLAIAIALAYRPQVYRTSNLPHRRDRMTSGDGDRTGGVGMGMDGVPLSIH